MFRCPIKSGMTSSRRLPLSSVIPGLTGDLTEGYGEEVYFEVLPTIEQAIAREKQIVKNKIRWHTFR